MNWFEQVQPASWRGIPFGVLNEEGEFGRRQALHEYPFRDTVFVEDLGRSTRRIELTGFLIGDDVIAQRESMIAAAEQPGPGQLVHPTLGVLNVSLMRFRPALKWDRGRYVELHFAFIEGGQRIFPSTIVSTLAAVLSAASGADGAASADFATSAATALKQGSAVALQAAGTVAIWARTAQRLGNDATNLTNMVSTLPGNFGRYFGGRNTGGFTGVTTGIQSSAASVSSLINAGATSRANINFAGINLNSIASAL